MRIYTPIVIIAAITHTAHSASFTEYIDKTKWQQAVGSWTTIGFSDLSPGTIVTTQYSSLGITFSDGDDNIDTTNSFLEDGYGLRGSFAFNPDDSINVEFETPIHWIGVDYPGYVQMDFFNQGELIYTTRWFDGGGEGFFSGVISTMPFDRVKLYDPFGFVFIDDLHFEPVPAPGALPLLGTLLLRPHRRRA